ncbi:MAG: hypothetical protein AVDCRST_MAG18-370, partial [uncultured Thermomicrobiales bacterium]
DGMGRADRARRADLRHCARTRFHRRAGGVRSAITTPPL